MNSMVQIALCGPSDVLTEIQKAKEIINEFNQREFAKNKIFLKHLHWEENSTPDLSRRPQETLNFQIIDEADVVVAIFRNRIGTSTGLYESGTAEEIKRAIVKEKKVMVYFSSLKTDENGDIDQKNKLEIFKNDLYSQGLCDSFNSSDEFGAKLYRHLLIMVNSLINITQEKHRTKKNNDIIVQQSQKGGNSNIQAISVGNITLNTKKSVISVLPPPDSVNQKELMRIKELIEKLAEGEAKIDRSSAYGRWTNRLKKHFCVKKLDFIKSENMQGVEAYCEKQLNLQKAGYKTKAPDQWRNNQYKAIKASMRNMGKTEESYYSELADRLKIKSGITSLTNLTKNDLTRIRRAVDGDLKKWNSLM